MSGSVDPGAFDFVNDLAAAIREGDITRDDGLADHSDAVTFCETFFDQFFAAIGVRIFGFGRREKEVAGREAERLRSVGGGSGVEDRRVIVQFERFCDLRSDLLGADYGGPTADFGEFYEDFLGSLLRASRDWATARGDERLSARIQAAEAQYTRAIEDRAWLTGQATRLTRSESVWRRLTSRGRTNS